MVPKVEWHIVDGLRNRNDVLAKGMSNARFIHDVWVSSCKIDDDNPRAKNEGENIWTITLLSQMSSALKERRRAALQDRAIAL